MIRFFFLARFLIEGHAGPVRLPTHKAESLLAYLLLHPGYHSREKLTALLWGDSPAKQARTSLRVALAAIRAQLGADVLETEQDRVQCRPAAGHWVDALEFHARATWFLDGSVPDLAPADLALYGGDLLPDLYHEWIVPLREHYRGLYLDCLLRLASVLRTRGKYERAAQCARRALAVDNLNEQAHRDLMLSHAALGERVAALKQYAACKRLLNDELGVAPAPATTALYEWVRRTEPRTEAEAVGVTYLPAPLTSFVGRKRELAEVRQALAATRLLTLTGPGGSGKTRLAIQLGAEQAAGFRDGVSWVELASLADAKRVPRQVAKALSVHEEREQGLDDELADYLRPRQVLLVLDNCEHLVPACARLATLLLEHCPELKILTTSREVLGVAGETTWRVPPLSSPDPGSRLAVAVIAEFESVRLFMERAVAVRPDLVLDDQNATSIAEVCRRLDGLPLAIELAAARVGVLSVHEIATRLDDRLALLTGGNRGALPRQQTLRAAFEWSYQLLTEAERRLFRRLSVFVGGFALEAAERMAGGALLPGHNTPGATPHLLDLLSGLVEKSLINAETLGGPARYRLLETIREFGLDQLQATGEAETTRQGYFDWCLALAESAAQHLAGADQARWYDKLEVELDNLRAALDWSLGREDGAWRSAGVRLAALLGQFWYVRGHFSEGRRWLERARPPAGAPVTAEQADVLYWQGFLAWMQADYGVARELFEQSKAVSELLGDRRGIARALQNEGLVLTRQGDYVAARALLERSLGLQRQLNDQAGALVSLFAAGRTAWFQDDLAGAHALLDQGLAIAQATGNLFLRSLALATLGDVAWSEGNYPLARERLDECLASFRELGNQQNTATTLLSLGYVALAQGELSAAQTYFSESLALYAKLGDKWGTANGLQGLGCLAAVENAPTRAGRLFGAAERVRAKLGSPLAIFKSEYDRQSAVVQAALGAEALAAAWAAGAALALEQAIDYALVGSSEV